MTEVSQHILSSKQVSDFLYHIKAREKELEQAEASFTLFDKYHHRRWFQRSMLLTDDQAWEKRQHYARLCDRLEQEIKLAKEKLAAHSWAKEQLESSMTPYEGLNMMEIKLEQAQLF